MPKDEILAKSPFDQFQTWMSEAEKSEPNDPNAMILATTTPDGHPSLRAVLLKGVDERGFVFYSNKESRKGSELAANPHTALLFHWKSLRRQVRIEERRATAHERGDRARLPRTAERGGDDIPLVREHRPEDLGRLGEKRLEVLELEGALSGDLERTGERVRRIEPDRRACA